MSICVLCYKMHKCTAVVFRFQEKKWTYITSSRKRWSIRSYISYASIHSPTCYRPMISKSWIDTYFVLSCSNRRDQNCTMKDNWCETHWKIDVNVGDVRLIWPQERLLCFQWFPILVWFPIGSVFYVPADISCMYIRGYVYEVSTHVVRVLLVRWR